MSKFNKFLDEENFSRESNRKFVRKSTTDFASVKLSKDTLEHIKVIKSLTRTKSISEVIDKALLVYEDTLSEEVRRKIKILLEG